MARFRLLPAALLACLAAAPARAGETVCWFDAGVVVVSAEVAGVAGDYILDTGAARTALHKDRVALPEGETITGDVRLAGLRIERRPVQVADLDVRTWNLPTPAAGVIGADVLGDYVVDVSFAPCRVRLSRPGEAPAFRGRRLAMSWDAGRPVVTAEADDGLHAVRGPFVVATGANAPVRLASDVAEVPGAAKPGELLEDGIWLARLPALRFAGAVGLDMAAGLMLPQRGEAGVIGGDALAHFRLRFDFPHGALLVTPAR